MKRESHGSYIMIEPIKEENGTWQGRVIETNKIYQKGNIVCYLESDIKRAYIDKKEIHVVLHYLIIFVDVLYKNILTPNLLGSDF
jgi:hypothetical protein